MIQYKKFTKAQAREFIKNMDELPEAAFEDVLAQWSELR